MLDPQHIKNWRLGWLQDLLFLSDIELQKSRWLNPNITNPAWTYVEFINGYFDDRIAAYNAADISNQYDYIGPLSLGLLSDDEYQCIKNFHEALGRYVDANKENQYRHEYILNDEVWKTTVALGQKSLSELRKIISDLSEQKLFEDYARPLKDADFTWPLKWEEL